MANTSGVAQIGVMAAGTLNAAPTGVVLMGLASNQSFTTEDAMVTKIERDDYEIAHQKLLTFLRTPLSRKLLYLVFVHSEISSAIF